MMRAATDRVCGAAAPSKSKLALTELPIELQVKVASFLKEARDRASLVLAEPRTLGLACRECLPWKGPLMKLAIACTSRPQSSPAGEADIRTFAHSYSSTREDAQQIQTLNTTCTLSISTTSASALHENAPLHKWYVRQRDQPHAGEASGHTLLRCDFGDYVMLFEGRRSEERMVRKFCAATGRAMEFKGGPCKERLVKSHDRCTIKHFRGRKGKEALVLCVTTHQSHLGSCLRYYKGESGRERLVKAVFPGRGAILYKGSRRRERMFAVRRSDGMHVFYKGERGAERPALFYRRRGAVVP